jgi:hypothetical protein
MSVLHAELFWDPILKCGTCSTLTLVAGEVSDVAAFEFSNPPHQGRHKFVSTLDPSGQIADLGLGGGQVCSQPPDLIGGCYVQVVGASVPLGPRGHQFQPLHDVIERTWHGEHYRRI